MGNHQTQLKGLEIDKKAIEVTDFWTLYSAEISGENRTNQVSIFQGENDTEPNTWPVIGPLEKAIKNLMIYRHPCIVKYIASWNRGSTRFLATERCRPLLLAGNQSDIEICLGLKNVLSALIFLVEQAGLRHLNVCSSSIYVTNEGLWKLAGFEYLWKANEITEVLLEKSKSYRYSKIIDANEVKNKGVGLEQYAFGVLCGEILNRIEDESSPFLKEFKSYCTTHLKHSTPTMRPKLSAVLLHSYFNHEFISIHTFLNELPLRNQQEKQLFFTSLIDRLRKFDEQVVASHLGNVLLSRIVLLDSSAQLCVVPFILKPRTDNIVPSLFSPLVYEKYIIPKIKQVFCVRDIQIRLILLEYFNFYINLFSKEDLQENILPQLLLGIKDTNEILVSTTLKCLADLVSILGASVVIGGNRLKLFTDGRPQMPPPQVSGHWIEARSITPVLTCVEFASSNSPIPDHVDISESYASNDNISHRNLMPERFSPDGIEDFKASENDDETWIDWEEDLDDSIQNKVVLSEFETLSNSNNNNSYDNNINESNNNNSNSTSQLSINQLGRQQSIPSITELDIKNQIVSKNKEEVDFFKDMEPIIQKTNILTIESTTATGTIQLFNETNVADPIKEPKIDNCRFNIKETDLNANDGWIDETENIEWDSETV